MPLATTICALNGNPAAALLCAGFAAGVLVATGVSVALFRRVG